MTQELVMAKTRTQQILFLVGKLEKNNEGKTQILH